MVGFYVCADAIQNWRSMAAVGNNVAKVLQSVRLVLQNG